MIAMITFLIGVAVSSSPLIRRESTPSAVNPEDNRKLIFEGTVLRVGPWVPGSGQSAFYRLAKYRVERVSYGHYEKSEILVDHLSLTTEELEGIKAGDRVCVTVRRTNTIFVRTNVSGIREESDKVDEFYVGGEVKVGSRCP
jgi:hypothetical protein